MAIKVGFKWEVVVGVGVEFEVNTCQKWKVVGQVGEKWEVVIKVGAESEVDMCENGKWWSIWVGNGKWWSKWLQSLKWLCPKVESGGQSG